MNHAAPRVFEQAPAKEAASSRLADIGLSFALFVLLSAVAVQINYEPAVPVNQSGYLTQVIMGTQGGDSYRRFIHLGVLLAAIGIAFIRGTPAIFRSISVPYMLASLWCLASFFWAIDPFASLKRSVGMVIVLVAIATTVNMLGDRKTFRVLYIFFATTLVASLITVALQKIPLFAFSVHPSNEADSALIGNWRGIFWHKNVAGPVMTHAMCVFLFFALNRRKPIDWLLFFGATLFLIGTRSKTALALAMITLSAAAGYRYLISKQNGNQIVVFVVFCILFSGVVLGVMNADKLYVFFTTPANLTGRVSIWLSLLNYVRDHLWLGSGYGSFYGIGYKSPIYANAVSPFVIQVLQSHNGYLEALATTGLIGLILALTALVFVPFFRFVNSRPSESELYACCFAIWFFGILQNFTEAQFFSPDKQSWIFVVIAITLIHRNQSDRRRAAASVRRRMATVKPVGFGSAAAAVAQVRQPAIDATIPGPCGASL